MATKWHILNRLRNIAQMSLRNCFQAWQLVLDYRRCHQVQERFSLQARTDRINHMLDEASQAAAKNDLFTLFNANCRLKKPRRLFR